MTPEQLSAELKKRQQLEAKVIARAWQDEEFRRLLVSDPRKAVGEVLGKPLPTELDVRVTEEAPASFHMILPPSPSISQELSHDALAKVAGGAFNAFLNFGDIKGESTDKDHKDWVQIL
jgi:hypothetical protein